MNHHPAPGLTLDEEAIRRLRGPKPRVDPWQPHSTLDEVERLPDGSHQRCRTVFLSGAECPFACVFCDLWRFTTDEPTPRGALPKQLESALDDGADGIDCLKLFNASNFFEARAVPPEDLPAIARLLADRPRVVIESHPRLVDQRCLDFAAQLDGELELALGLETAHPEALARLNKRMSLDDFDRACDFARRHDLGLRAFVLLGAPYVPAQEGLHWVEQTVRHAVAQGVDQIALIPLRADNGPMQELAKAEQFLPFKADEFEQVLASALGLASDQAAVSIDLWDIEGHLEGTPCCAAARIASLEAMNLSGTPRPPVVCSICESAT